MRGQLQEKSQRCCSASLVFTLMLWASLRISAALPGICWRGTISGTYTLIIHCCRSEVSTQDHWNLKKNLLFHSVNCLLVELKCPSINFFPAFSCIHEERGDTSTAILMKIISAFQFCTALSYQAHSGLYCLRSGWENGVLPRVKMVPSFPERPFTMVEIV